MRGSLGRFIDEEISRERSGGEDLSRDLERMRSLEILSRG